jgi:hypothetical protein
MSVFYSYVSADLVLSQKNFWNGGALAGLADVDGDGRKDVLTESDFPNKAGLYYGNGSPFGGWPVSLSVQASPYPVAGDLNSDGKKEIVAAQTSGRVAAIYSNGSVMWNNSACSSLGFAGIDYGPVLADLNGDSIPEMIFSCKIPSSPSVIYVLNSAGNPYASWESVTANGIASGTPSAFDLNGDGKKEIIVSGMDLSSNGYFVQSFHDNGVQDWLAYPEGASASQIPPLFESPSIAEVDGDGAPEIVSTSYNGSYSRIHVISASGVTERAWNMNCGSASNTIVAGSGSGAAIISYCNGVISSWKADGTLTWNSTVGVNIDATWIERYPAAGDVNGDGLMEVVVPAGKRLFIFSASGVVLVNRTLEEFFDTCYHLTTPSIGDVDGDSRAELVLGAQSRCDPAFKRISVNGVVQRPNLVLFNPKNQTYNFSFIPLEYSAWDSVPGIGSIGYSVDGGNNVSLSGNTTIPVADGSHVLAVYARDTAGNVNSTIVAFTVDSVPPRIWNVTDDGIRFAYPGESFPGSLAPPVFYTHVSWNTDEPSNSAVNLGLEGNQSYSFQSSSEETSHSELIFWYLNYSRTYYYSVSSCDPAGNCNSSGTYNFTTPGCPESWSCTGWSACSGGVQVRVCTDAHDCGTTAGKLPENQTCVIPPPVPPSGGGGGGSGAYCGDGIVQKWTGEECESNSDCNSSYECKACKCVRACAENWTCTSWSGCASAGGFNTRKCTDTNNCGTRANAPQESRGCVTATGGVSVKINPPFLDINAVSEITCGNGNCSEGKTCANCPGDCGPCDDAIADSGQGHDLAGLMTGAIQYSLSGLIVTAVIFLFLLSAIWKQ